MTNKSGLSLSTFNLLFTRARHSPCLRNAARQATLLRSKVILKPGSHMSQSSATMIVHNCRWHKIFCEFSGSAVTDNSSSMVGNI